MTLGEYKLIKNNGTSFDEKTLLAESGKLLGFDVNLDPVVTTVISALGYTPENVANRVTSISSSSTNLQYPTAKLLWDQLALKQTTNTNLSSLAGLTYASASFVKMTAAGTFTLDTNTYLTAEADTLGTVTARGAMTSTTLTLGDVNISSGKKLTGTTQGFVDINRCGFLDQTETTISFNPSTFVFTLADVGTGWSYYRGGVKYTISGNKTINLTTIDAVLIDGQKYFITINSVDGTLSASKIVWTLTDTVLPVAIVAWNNTLNPKFFLQEERHTIALDRRMHLYLHNTRGTQYITGAELTGFTTATNADAANSFAIAQAVIADEDMYETLLAKADGNGADATNYLIMYRSGVGNWVWEYSDMPFKYTAAGYINWDNAGTITQGTGGTGGSIRYYNTYLILTNTQGEGRFVFVAGQNSFTSITNAYAETFANFDLVGFPKTEWLALYQCTWQTGAAGLTNKGKVQLTRIPQRITTSAITASSTSTTDHNALAGLQGGLGTTEFYHLSAAQYTIATQAASTSLSGYLSSTDWNTFNSKQSVTTNLTSLSGLTYVSASFVKMTAAGTFTLDTNVYSTDIHSNITALNAVSGTNTGDNAANSLYSGLVSFPGFGITNITAAYGDHLHAGVYEPAFSKNTAFNKNFGTAAGTVTEGNDSRVLNGQTAFGWGNHAGLYAPITGSTNYIQNQITSAQVANSWISGRSIIGNSLAVFNSGYSILYLNEKTTDVSQNVLNLQSSLEITVATDSSKVYTSAYYNITITGSANLTGRAVGQSGQINHQGSGTIAHLRGVSGVLSNESTGTMTNAYGGRFYIQNTGAGTITNAFNLYVVSTVKSAGTITNNYGLYIENQAAGTNNYAIYSAGGDSYHLGSLGLGMLPVSTTKLSINAGADTNVGQVIQAYSATQSANLIEFRDYLGNVKTTIDAKGALYQPSTSIFSNPTIDPVTSTTWNFSLILTPTIQFDAAAYASGNGFVANNFNSIFNPISALTSGVQYGYGALFQVATPAASSIDLTYMDYRGFYGYVTHNANTTLGWATGAASRVWITGNGNIGVAKSLWVRNTRKDGTGTVTTNYGIYLDSQTAGVTNYAIYSAGGNSYFAGGITANLFAKIGGTSSQFLKADGSVDSTSYQAAGTYSTDIHSNITALNAVSGTNTGDNAINTRYEGVSGMIYPGAGIAVSTGSAWTTSITDNSANWNVAYGWGNHASAGYLTSLGTALVDADFTNNGIMIRTSAGVYSTTANNSSNWDTAYGWGNHVGLYSLLLHAHTGVYEPAFSKNTGFNLNVGTTAGTLAAGDDSRILNGATAYGWGNHASAGYLTSQTSHADVVQDGDFTSQGIILRGATSGVYSILTDNSTNWNSAYGWGNHASAGYLTSLGTALVDADFATTGLMKRGASSGDYSIVTDNSANWNTAFGWGNHAGLYLPVAGTAADSDKLDGQHGTYYAAASTFANYLLLSGGTLTGDLSITKSSPKLYLTDTTLTLGLSSEIGGQLINYGTNYPQLGNVNAAYPGGFFRIDVRAGVETEFFNIKFIPAGLTETTVFKVSTTGDVVASGTIAATGGNSTNWNSAYGWGNHASAGYALSSALASYSLTSHNHSGVYQPAGTYSTDIHTNIAALNAVSGTNTGDNAINSLYSGLVTMTYPAAGIALSTGSAWGTSIVNNSGNWNTAYGWGNHASAGYQAAATAITTSNIGSQSVSYAATAGSAPANGGNSATVASLTPANFFNNMGQGHSTNSDFNAVADFGFRFFQGATNGPAIPSATQYYGMTLGLGSDYALSSYGSQIYWPRVPNGGLPYISVRFMEASSWSAWSKIYAGYADTAGSAPASDVYSWAKAATKPTYTYSEVGAAASGHDHSGVYQPAGTYSTDIHSNITALNAVSGTNTGDNAVNTLYSGLVSFPGFGTTGTTAAYGNHNHSGVYELALGNPSVDGYILSSTVAGVRSWIAPPTGGGSGQQTKFSVTQVGHGLAVGDIIKSTGANTYGKAQADSAANAEVVGIVTVVSGNDFTYVAQGVIETGVPAQTAGTVMFLSPTTAGAMTVTEPETTGQISKPILVVLENGTKALFNNFRGLAINGVPGGQTVSVVSGNTSATTGILYVLTASLTLTLPTSPSVGHWIKVSNMSATSTCVIARNGSNIMGLAEDLNLDKLNAGFEMIYADASKGWVII